MFKFARFFSLILFGFSLVLGKAQDLNFVNFTTDNGLPSNECYRIVQDKAGYIWISTELGLVKYNARDFILFDGSKGLPYRNIYALDIDDAGRVWFATGDWKIGYVQNDRVFFINVAYHVDKNGVINQTSIPISTSTIYKIKFEPNSKDLFIYSTHITLKISNAWTPNPVFNFFRFKNNDKDFFYYKQADFYTVLNWNNYFRGVDYTHNSNLFKSYYLHLKKDSIPINKQNRIVTFNQVFDLQTSNELIIGFQNTITSVGKSFYIKKQFAVENQIQCIKQLLSGDILIGCKKTVCMFSTKP